MPTDQKTPGTTSKDYECITSAEPIVDSASKRLEEIALFFRERSDTRSRAASLLSELSTETSKRAVKGWQDLAASSDTSPLAAESIENTVRYAELRASSDLRGSDEVSESIDALAFGVLARRVRTLETYLRAYGEVRSLRGEPMPEEAISAAVQRERSDSRKRILDIDAEAELSRRLREVRALLASGAVEEVSNLVGDTVGLFEQYGDEPRAYRLYDAIAEIDCCLGYPDPPNLDRAATIAELALKTPSARVFLESLVPRAALVIRDRLDAARRALVTADQLAEGAIVGDLEAIREAVEAALTETNRLSITETVAKLRNDELLAQALVEDSPPDAFLSPVFQGARANRLREQPRERAAAQLWEAANTGVDSISVTPPSNPGELGIRRWQPRLSLLGRLLSRDEKGIAPTARDWYVASTVAQWLGTESGLAFLSQVLFATSEIPRNEKP